MVKLSKVTLLSENRPVSKSYLATRLILRAQMAAKFIPQRAEMKTHRFSAESAQESALQAEYKALSLTSSSIFGNFGRHSQKGV